MCEDAGSERRKAIRRKGDLRLRDIGLRSLLRSSLPLHLSMIAHPLC